MEPIRGMVATMKPAGRIDTYIRWRDWKELPFNFSLFLFQLAFLIVGKIIGRVEVGWNEIWHAAQVSHVRLCLGESGLKSSKEWAKIHKSNVRVLDPDGWDRSNFTESWNEKIKEAEFKRRCSYSTCEWNEKGFYGSDSQQISTHDYINFGYPKAEIQPWRMDMIDNKRFRYFDPTFKPSDKFIEAMIQYARDQEGKGYDDLQLISSGLHLIAWIVYPPSWGKELKIIKALNRKGGREFCSSGLTACLRWGEGSVDERQIRQKIRSIHERHPHIWGREDEEITDGYIDLLKRMKTKFFKGYDTAVVPPCLALLSKNWEEKDE